MVGLDKVIAELSYSPASVEKIAVYAQRIKKQQKLYGWALFPLIILSAVSAIFLFFPYEKPYRSASLQPAQSMVTNRAFSPSITTDTETAKPNSIVTWKIALTNTSSEGQTGDVILSTGDIERYADIIYASSEGIISSKHHQIIWSGLSLSAGEEKEIIVESRIHDPISSQLLASQPNCQITATLKNTATTDIACPAMTRVGSLIQQISPKVSFLTGFLVSIALLLVTLAAYATCRIQAHEIRVIRQQLNSGGIE